MEIKEFDPEGIIISKLKGGWTRESHNEVKMKWWMQKGGIMMSKLKGWMDKEEHNDVEMKGWIEKMA